ncbi:MAG: SH3 domain-containing protein [Clostridia bacterium]|nr:SH3 domain-containing protein [Clostridia bacterium]
MKRIVLVLAALCLLSTAHAQILPPDGPGQLGIPAVVLCQSLTVRESPATSAKSVGKLRYGDLFYTQDAADGWAPVFQGENEGCLGYVKSEFLAFDPGWYVTGGSTSVWAWGETSPNVPKVALLDKGEKLPILKDSGDWLVVSLRGAAGWIKKTAADKAPVFQAVSNLYQAEMHTASGVYVLTNPDSLRRLEALLAAASPIQTPSCPFQAKLVLRSADGNPVTLEVATDSCPNLRTADGQHYQLNTRATELWQLFGLNGY